MLPSLALSASDSEKSSARLVAQEEEKEEEEAELEEVVVKDEEEAGSRLIKVEVWVPVSARWDGEEDDCDGQMSVLRIGAMVARDDDEEDDEKDGVTMETVEGVSEVYEDSVVEGIPEVALVQVVVVLVVVEDDVEWTE